jgi:hypothetical protein
VVAKVARVLLRLALIVCINIHPSDRLRAIHGGYFPVFWAVLLAQTFWLQTLVEEPPNLFPRNKSRDGGFFFETL